jgi:hypothetical protein
MHAPAMLPPILAVELLRVKQGLHEDFQPENILQERRFDGDIAQQFASLWRKLSGKDWKRCHIPVYGLRFQGEQGEILTASLRWECDNIRIQYSDGTKDFCAFDATSASAQELLALCKALLPRSPELQVLTPEQCRRVEDALEEKP